MVMKKLVAMFSEHRLVVLITFEPLELLEHGDICIWDWRNGHKMLVSAPELSARRKWESWFTHAPKQEIGQPLCC
jgi:hypothetical protein